jgi:DNA-binding NarL/FixJ family response regulator
MPDASGESLVYTGFGQYIYVIALSSRPEVRDSALAAGADAFVSKIDSPERLLEAIADCEQLRDTRRR